MFRFRKRAAKPRKPPELRPPGKLLTRWAMEDNLRVSGYLSIGRRNRTVEAELSRPFIYTPKSKLICTKLELSQVEGALTKRCMLTRGRCTFGTPRKPRNCVGKLQSLPAYRFRILCGGRFDYRRCDFILVNQLVPSRLRTAPTERAGLLSQVYEKIRGIADPATARRVGTPKPGNSLFYTLLEGKPDMRMILLDGREVKGKLLAFHEPPGGLIDLLLGDGGGVKDIIGLSMVAVALIERAPSFKGDRAEFARKLGLALLSKGHIVSVYPEQNLVYELCKAPEVIVLKKGEYPKGLDPVDEHDRAILDAWRRA